MLTRRIIPCLDVRDGRVVKGKQFSNIIDVDDPARLGKIYSDSSADELVFYDITASNEKRQISLQFVEDVAKQIDIPFCVGGGIKTIEDVTNILRKGADKVSINSAAVTNPTLITDAAKMFGSQCIVLSVDVKEETEGNYIVYINGGRKSTKIDAIQWIQKGVKLGAGEVVVNSINFDGMKQGYDKKLLQIITNSVNVPVIASGGAGTINHFVEIAKDTSVDGILAASVFHFHDLTIQDVKNEMKKANIPIRILEETI